MNTFKKVGINCRLTIIFVQIFICINCMAVNDLGVKVDWEPAKDSFLIGEPVKIVLNLTNVSNNIYGFSIDKFDLYTFYFDAQIDGKNAEHLLQRDPLRSKGGFLPNKMITPTAQVIFYLNNYIELNQPGIYTVYAYLNLKLDSDPRNTIKSAGFLSTTNTFHFLLKKGTKEELHSILAEYSKYFDTKDPYRAWFVVKNAEALASLKNDNVVKYLTPGFQQIENSSISSWAAKSLIETHTPLADAALLNGLTNGTDLAKNQILKCMYYKKSCPDGTIPIVRNLLQSSNNKIRKSSIYYLSAVNATNCIEDIRKFLNDPDRKVKNSAQFAIDQLSKMPNNK